MPPRGDAALAEFDRLRVREVNGRGSYGAFFLAQFQSTAAELGPKERIKLEMAYESENLELLTAALASPQAGKICALFWVYDGKEDVNSIAPLLVNNCPELASLQVHFDHHSVFDFVSSVLEHPSNKVKVLEMPPYTKGDLARFFAALEQSQVSALTLYNSPELREYLAKDLLVRLKVMMDDKQVPSEVVMSLAKCTRLAEFEMLWCTFSQPTAFTRLPKSITTIKLGNCTFVGSFDWSFLAGSSMQELDFLRVEGIDGNQLGSTLAVHLRTKGLDELCIYGCDFTNETLAAVGVELGRIKRLDLGGVDNASVELISRVLQSPNNEMRKLNLGYTGHTTSHLVVALRHPNCNLAKLRLSAFDIRHIDAAQTLNHKFRNRLALFVLLQGQQVRRKSPLRRLPVEMFRLVGQVLL